MKKAQSWTIDFGAGLLIFLLALSLSYGVFMNVIDDQSYGTLQNDAYRLADMLVGSGYPELWDSSDIIRPGLLSDDRLSIRKLELLTSLSNNELKDYFAVKNFAFFIVDDGVNYTDSIVNFTSIKNNCFIGDPLSVTVNDFISYKRIAHYGTGSELNNFVNTYGDLYTNFSSLYSKRYFYDIIIFEDPIFINELSANLSIDQLNTQLEEIASLGTTLIFTGNLSVPLLGVSINLTNITSSSNKSIINHDALFNLNVSDEINFTKTYDLSVDSFVTHSKMIAEDNSIFYWQYKDSKVYYFSDVSGSYGALNFKDVIIAGLTNELIKGNYLCTFNGLQKDNLVMVERLLPFKGSVKKLFIYVWD